MAVLQTYEKLVSARKRGTCLVDHGKRRSQP